MNGRDLAIGAATVLAAAGFLTKCRRRGSRNWQDSPLWDQGLVPVGYHCSNWPIGTAYNGTITGYLERASELWEVLPNYIKDKAYGEGIGPGVFSEDRDHDPDAWRESFDDWISEQDLAWIWVAELPLGGLTKGINDFGDNCYLVWLPKVAAVGEMVDHLVDGWPASAYLYRPSIGVPVLEEIDPWEIDRQEGRIEADFIYRELWR